METPITANFAYSITVIYFKPGCAWIINTAPKQLIPGLFDLGRLLMLLKIWYLSKMIGGTTNGAVMRSIIQVVM